MQYNRHGGHALRATAARNVCCALRVGASKASRRVTGLVWGLRCRRPLPARNGTGLYGRNHSIATTRQTHGLVPWRMNSPAVTRHARGTLRADAALSNNRTCNSKRSLNPLPAHTPTFVAQPRLRSRHVATDVEKSLRAAATNSRVSAPEFVAAPSALAVQLRGCGDTPRSPWCMPCHDATVDTYHRGAPPPSPRPLRLRPRPFARAHVRWRRPAVVSVRDCGQARRTGAPVQQRQPLSLDPYCP
eukprot:365023-Chlamydomonas_euryale.AAC.21